MNFFIVSGAFFLLLPMLVVWLGDHEKISTTFFSFLTAGCWLVGFPLVYFGLHI